MFVMRLRQAADLVRPTARAMSWQPSLWAALLALAYVAKEARDGYIGDRMLALRVAMLLLCIGAAFVLDDPTEETIGHVPTPLLLRRALRIALVLPFISLTWLAMMRVAGTVPAREGGPMPLGDLTLEAATLLTIAVTAACAGAALTSDRLGGVIAAPVVLTLVGIAMFLPGDHRMILPSPADVRWEDAHDWWGMVLVAAIAGFIWLNRSAGSPSLVLRLRSPTKRPRRSAPVR